MDYRLVLIVFSLSFAIFPIAFFLLSKNEKHIKIVFLILTILYSIIVCIGVFSNIKLGKTISISLFENTTHIKKEFNFNLSNIGKTDFIINILMFIPLGFLLNPLFKKRATVISICVGLIFSIFIETMQLLLPIIRGPELTDIILNTISCFVGVCCYLILKTIKIKFKK